MRQRHRVACQNCDQYFLWADGENQICGNCLRAPMSVEKLSILNKIGVSEADAADALKILGRKMAQAMDREVTRAMLGETDLRDIVNKVNRELKQRLVVIRVSRQLEIGRDDMIEVLKAMPDDAKLVHVSMQWETGCYTMTFQSIEFPVTPEGGCIPIRSFIVDKDTNGKITSARMSD